MIQRFSFRWPAAVLAFVTALAVTPALAQGKWWQSDRFQRELQLTPDQITRIEEVFQAAIPDLRQHKKTLDELETGLSRLIDTAADETVVMQAADRVEAERSELSKARTRMLLRIRRVLSPDQRAKLAVLHDEWERERKRQNHRN